MDRDGHPGYFPGSTTQCAEGALWLVTPSPGVDPHKSSSPECLLKLAALAISVPSLSSNLHAPVCAASACRFISPIPEFRRSAEPSWHH